MENDLQYSNVQQADTKKIVVPCSMCSGNHEEHVPNCPNDYTVFAMLLQEEADGDSQRF